MTKLLVVLVYILTFIGGNSFGVPWNRQATWRHATSRQSAAPAAGSFDNFLSTMDLPVLVDFYAEWCGPCKKMKPILSDVATRLENIAKVAKVDTDKAPKLSAKYGIRALPTLILFNQGQEIKRFEGFRSADDVEKLVLEAMKNKGIV